MNMNLYDFINFRNKWLLLRDTIIFSITAFLILCIADFFKNYIAPLAFITNSPEPVRVLFFLLYSVLAFIGFRTLLDNVVEKYRGDKSYKFKSAHWPTKWLFNGEPTAYKISELFVRFSRAGCLLRNHYWKNFLMTFEMKFVDNLSKNLGVIFRANDLDNYFMLEILQDGGGLALKPHVRYRGGWEIVGYVSNGAYDSTRYVKVELECNEDFVDISIDGSLVHTWVLPTHVDIMFRESGSENQKQESSNSTKVGKRENISAHVQEIPFRNNYGMIGFRAHPGQGAMIKGLEVHPIKKFS